jgi:EAL domain-containing protein (putative c-di-GMP-specific phosphodiesterase class I)
VRDVLVDPSDATIAKNFVTLAQKDFLASHGCHAYRGYFFSRPLSIDQFAAFAHKG